MAIDISGIFLFMPIFSFLFVFLIVFAILNKTKILGGEGWTNMFVGMIMAIIFLSFSSLALSDISQNPAQHITPKLVVLQNHHHFK